MPIEWAVVDSNQIGYPSSVAMAWYCRIIAVARLAQSQQAATDLPTGTIQRVCLVAFVLLEFQ